ncbi:MAG TPA: DUF3592 domain-containing protein [Planctomicrobium sp.]|nr:DUF3592 domain-containing protein [Planctomicrobium sp.]
MVKRKNPISRQQPESLTTDSGKHPLFETLTWCIQMMVIAGVGVFIGAIGVAILWAAMIRPGIDLFEAQSWQLTPCTILASESQGAGDSFKVRIEYQYEVNQQEFKGDRYSFFPDQTDTQDGIQEIVDAYPVESEQVCFTDPENPEQSVLNRDFSSEMLWGLIGLPFAILGAVALFVPVLSRRKKRRTKAFENLSDPVSYGSLSRLKKSMSLPNYATLDNNEFSEKSLEDSYSPLELKTTSSRLGGFLGLTFFTLIWNGVIVLIAFAMLGDLRNGHINWLPAIIIGLFAIIGLGLIAGSIYTFMGLFNPLPVLSLNRSTLPLGSTATLNWHLQGTSHSVKFLKISLKGTEHATYRQGTKITTDTDLFYGSVLIETADPATISAGTTTFTLPSDSMHTLTAPSNKIIWELNVHGEISNWPDIRDNYTIRVVPHE